MKKFSQTLSAVLMAALLLTACGPKTAATPETAPAPSAQSKTEDTTPTPSAPSAEAETKDDGANVPVSIIALKGPTSMGMVKMMKDAENPDGEAHNLKFEIASAVDEVSPKIVKGDVDIAAVPANLASVLYNKSDGKISVLGINTLGVLYIVGLDSDVSTITDLKGRTLYAAGKGATPEYVLRYLLQKNGLDPDTDVNIEWKSEHTECLQAISIDESGQALAMLPQPFVTVAQTKLEGIESRIDLTKEWDQLQKDSQEPSTLVTGVTVVRKDFAKEHPEAVKAFMRRYAESVKFVNDSVDEAAELIGSYEIVPAPIAKKAIPACRISWIEGKEMQSKLSGYLNVLAEQNPKAVGGKVPADDFYYMP